MMTFNNYRTKKLNALDLSKDFPTNLKHKIDLIIKNG